MNSVEIGPAIYLYTEVGLSESFLEIIKDPSIVFTKANDGLDTFILNKDLNQEIYNLIDKKFTEIEKDYLKNFNIDSLKMNLYDKRQILYFLKYNKVVWDTRHFDDIHQDDPRRVSVVYYPNDDYEGGEIEFPRFNVKIKPPKDSALIFSASYPYDHLVHEISGGTRYAIGSHIY